MTHRYATPIAGHPPQSDLITEKAVFTDAYAVIPRGCLRDIVASCFPFWSETRAWVLSRPMTGFAETFSCYAVEVAPGGGSERPETDPRAQAALLVLAGTLSLGHEGQTHLLPPGGFAYLPAGDQWRAWNGGDEPCHFLWVRKPFEPVEGLAAPEPVFAEDRKTTPVPMPGTEGRWSTTRFVDPTDLRYDFHLNIVNFEPGASIPFPETHVMEHGIYVLEGKAAYKLNRDWVEVEAGDYLWLRAFCPQACIAAGPGPFRYALYKDVNRHMPFLSR